jgi:hypothetical protein
MGQGLSGSSKPIIAGTELQLGTIADSGRSSIRTIRDNLLGHAWVFGALLGIR